MAADAPESAGLPAGRPDFTPRN